MHPDYENISLEPGKSFRSYHWKMSADEITLHGDIKATPQAVITPKQSKGVGHLWHFHKAHEKQGILRISIGIMHNISLL